MQNLNNIQDLYNVKIECDNLDHAQEIAARSKNIEDQVKSYWEKNNYPIYDFYTLHRGLGFRDDNYDQLPNCGQYWYVPEKNALYVTSYKSASTSLNHFFRLASDLGTTCYQNQEHLSNNFAYDENMSYKNVNYKEVNKVLLFREPIQRLKSALQMLARQNYADKNLLAGTTDIYPWSLVNPADAHIKSQMFIVPIDIDNFSLSKIIRFAALCTPNWRDYFDDIDKENFGRTYELFSCITKCIPLFLKLTFDLNTISPTAHFFAIEESGELTDPFRAISRDYMPYKNEVSVSFKENDSRDKDQQMGVNFHKEAKDYINLALNKKPYMPTEFTQVNRSLMDIFSDQISTEIEFYNLMSSREYRQNSKYNNCMEKQFFENMKIEK